MKQGVQNYLSVYLTAAVLSLLLAGDGIWRATIINADGICYLQSAATIGMAGLREAMQVCGQAQWPFYSLLIHSVSLLSPLSLIHSAYFLNGIFSLLTVIAFITLIRLFTQKKSVIWFAAATILLNHEFNSVREYVIRDHGFWAFYLTSVVLLIQYFRKPSWQGAMLWGGALIVATLFRVEGVLFLVIMPWLAWFACERRLQQFLQLNLLNLIGAAAVLVYVLFHQQDSLTTGRFGELLFQAQHGLQVLAQTFSAKSAALAQAILNGYSARDAKMIFALMIISWYVVSVITNLSLVYAGLAVFAYSKKCLTLDRAARLTFTGYILINALITIPFLLEYQFLSKRYLIAMSLLLMVWVPFGLAYIWEQRRTWMTTAAAVLVIGSAIGGIVDFGYSKKYIREAGLWLASNTPAQATIYSNDMQVMYYSGHFGNDIITRAHEFANLSELKDNKWQQYDYLAVHVDPRDPQYVVALQDLPMKPVKVFANRRGDAILIYVRPNKEM